MSSMTKMESLSRLDTEFLTQLCAELNEAYRNYTGHSRDELLKLLTNKLQTNQIEAVRRQYLLCRSPTEVANSVSPDSTTKIYEALRKRFDEPLLREVKIGRKRCDAVIPDGVIAIEVKSARDRIERAIKQTAQYQKWAKSVYLVYDVAHKERVPTELHRNGVGLIEYDDGTLSLQRSPNGPQTPLDERLEWLTYDYLVQLAHQHNTQSSGNKKEIAVELSEKLSPTDIDSIFEQYILNKSK